MSQPAFIHELLTQLECVEPEWIATFETGRHFGPIRLRDRVRTVGRGWRLGALILDTQGTLYATGTVLRTEREHIRGTTSRLAAERAELRAAARRGGIPAGRTINIDPRRLDLDHPEPPLRLGPAGWECEWSPAVWAPLESYLSERAQLLQSRAQDPQ